MPVITTSSASSLAKRINYCSRPSYSLVGRKTNGISYRPQMCAATQASLCAPKTCKKTPTTTHAMQMYQHNVCHVQASYSMLIFSVIPCMSVMPCSPTLLGPSNGVCVTLTLPLLFDRSPAPLLPLPFPFVLFPFSLAPFLAG